MTSRSYTDSAQDTSKGRENNNMTKTTHMQIVDFMSTTVLRIGKLSESVEAEEDVMERILSAINNPAIVEVYFWNVEFTTGIIEALRKLIHCDGRQFTIKLLSCRGLMADVVSILVATSNVCGDADTMDVDKKNTVDAAVPTLVLNGPVLENRTVAALQGQRSLKHLRLLGVRSEYHDSIDIGNCVELDLTHSRLFMAPNRCLIDSLGNSQHLQCLKLDFCNLSDSELCQILRVCPISTLRELHLSHNNCSTESMDILVHRLVSPLNNNSALSVLNLHHQTTKQNTKNIPWNLLFEALRHANSSSLTKLDVSGNPLDESNISVLAESLKSNVVLESINLSYCQLSAESISALASQMPHWTANLRRLDLSGCHYFFSSCGNNSAQPQPSPTPLLVCGLQRNYYLDFIGNMTYLPSTSALEMYLDCNRCGRRLLKGKSSPATTTQSKPHRALQSALWPEVLARIPKRLPVLYSAQGGKRLGRRESALYYFLRHGPVLLER